MKIRISSDTLNFRVSLSECEELASNKNLKERISFPGGPTLEFMVKVFPEKSSGLRLERQENEIVLTCSLDSLVQLKENFPKQVGLYGEAPHASELMKFSLEIDLKGGPRK